MNIPNVFNQLCSHRLNSYNVHSAYKVEGLLNFKMQYSLSSKICALSTNHCCCHKTAKIFTGMFYIVILLDQIWYITVTVNYVKELDLERRNLKLKRRGNIIDSYIFLHQVYVLLVVYC